MNLALLLTLAGVIIAIIGLCFQILRSNFSMSVDLTLKLDERFNSDSFKKVRRVAAKNIIKRNFREADEVFDFFETLGLLLRKHALDKEMTWNTFFYWIHRYWIAGSDYIADEQRDDPTTWEDFKYLHEEVIKVEKSRTGASDSDLLLSTEDIKEFLRDESAIK
jgi:hypothetical protein